MEIRHHSHRSQRIRFGIGITAGVVLLLCASCVTNRSTKYLQNIREDFGKAQYEEYRLQPKDEILFQVFTTNEDAAKMFNTAGRRRRAISSEAVGSMTTGRWTCRILTT